MSTLFELLEDDIADKYKKLKEDIEKYNHFYYNLDQSLVTDYEYDMLMKELIELEKEYPYLKDKTSPTALIGGVSSNKFKKVKHNKAMLSLSNTYNMVDIENFDLRVKKIVGRSVDYVLELKLDGLSISLIYEKGILKQGITRGDGSIGEDVTENIMQISSIPKKLNSEIDIEVRGEIVLPLSEFVRINNEKEEAGETVFANPRNAAAGTLRQLDKDIVKERNLDCYIYYLIDFDKFNIKTHIQSIEFIKSLGFKTTNVFEKCENLKQLEERISYWDIERKKLDFETDGMVIKVNDFSLYNELGFTAKSPRWAIAYKFMTEKKETKLLDVSYQVGRTGVVTPVAELKAVNLSGSIVKRASLHNFDEIERLGLKIGDIVVIEKAAEIIPQVIGVNIDKRKGNEKDIEIPKLCPSCQSELEKERDIVALKCKNDNCPEKVKKKIEYFVSRDALNIQGLGSKIVARLLELGLISDFLDIYELHNHRETLIGLEKMGEKSVDKLLENIEKSKTISFDKIIYSLGIDYVGKSASKVLAQNFKNIDNLINAKLEELLNIEGIGDKVANSILNYFKNNKNFDIIYRLKYYGFNLSYEEEVKEYNSFITGYSFLATGKLNTYTRDEIKEIIIRNNGKYISSVSKNLDYLIVGEKAGSKLAKAEKLGIKILTEDEFIEKLKK